MFPREITLWYKDFSSNNNQDTFFIKIKTKNMNKKGGCGKFGIQETIMLLKKIMAC